MDGQVPGEPPDSPEAPARAGRLAGVVSRAVPWLPHLLMAVSLVAGAAGIVYWLSARPRPAPVEITLATPAPASPPVVHVAGAVASPGVYSLPPDARVRDAIDAAGGALADADVEALNLAAFAIDGSRIDVPRISPAQAGAVYGTVVPAAGAAGGGTAGPIDLNTAQEIDLERLPGIGPVLAKRIVEWRSLNGPFISLDDLLGVPGIGSATAEGLRGLVVQE